MPDLFSRLAARSPDALAGRRAGEPVRHAALLARIRSWAALGRRAGTGPVALHHEDSLEFAAALVGAWLAGKTVWLAADVLPATCAALAGRVDAFWGDFPAACAPRVPADADGAGADAAWRAPVPDFPALVVFTSGTTGAPVPIPKRFAQLTSELDALEAQFGAALGDADVVATVSHQHIYGLLFRILWPLAAGRPLHAARHEFPETLAPALAVRPAVLLASPAHLKRLPAHLDWDGAAAHLRAVFSSGGMLETEAARHAAALLGRAPIEVYGSSETGGIAWRQRTAGADEGWTPLPGVAWRAGADGLLAVRSAQAGTGDWQTLADRVEEADGGRFVLRGRADRIVKIEEKRISLDAIEAALLAGGLVREARVLAGPDAGRGRQVLAAFVVPSDAGRAALAEGGKSALNARLRAQLASGLEAVALPRRWRYLDALPVDARGKTTAAQLLALLDPAPARPRDPAVRVLERDAARVLLELTVPADLLYFDGHFAVAPVLPGVVQVDWAIRYGAQYLGCAGAFAGIQALKFQQMIRPEQPVRLELSRDAAKGSLAFRYFSAAGAHASGRILSGPDQAC
ncbi:AMP-binding protein [Massilia luteola]|uniref:AMP-binding protein n=1 Tax=Massilia luteola TaxID=3081751 RepID=UPI002ACBFDAD|nr:AMP-binding protein [Massilia sp. Gc5]